MGSGGGPDYPGSDSGSMSYWSYLATLQGVSVVFAAGNDGPGWYTVANAGPWVMTVGASSIDRGSVGNKVVLGNGTEIIGVS